MPGPPRIPSNVGQQANPSSHGLSVPVMHSQPTTRHPPRPHAPSGPQYPEQQPMQFAPHAQYAGHATASPLHRPPKHWLGGTHVPDPPGRFTLSGQQTSPSGHDPGTPALHRHPSAAHGRTWASTPEPPLPRANPPTTAAPTARPSRPNTPRRDRVPASRRVSASNLPSSIPTPPGPFRVLPFGQPGLFRARRGASDDPLGQPRPSPLSRAPPQVPAVPRAALRARIPPIARVRTVSARPRAGRVAIARVGADASSPRSPRRRRAADQPIVAWVQRPGRAPAPDICAVEPRSAPLRRSHGQQRPRQAREPADGAPSRTPPRHRPRHHVEPLPIHRRASCHPACLCSESALARYRDWRPGARGNEL